MSFPTTLRPAVLSVSASVREARERRKIGLRQLARQLDIPAGRLSSLELADHIPHPHDVARILGCLGVVGAEYDQIMKLSKHVYIDNFVVQHDAEAFSLTWTYEQLADRIVEWAPTCLPDLLRLPQHLERELGADEACSRSGKLEQLERSARRQAMQDGPRRYVFLIGEDAVRAARDQGCGDEQIQRVRSAASLPNVSARVVPTTAIGLNPPAAFTFFERRLSSMAVAFHHVHCTTYLTEKSLLGEYFDTAKTLQRQALSESETIDTLNHTARGRAS